MPDVPLVYWDACIFYEWLHGNQPDLRRKHAITQCIQDNGKKQNRIFTSTITHIEVLPKKVSLVNEERYKAQFSSLYFFDIDVSRQIVMLAREVKDYYYFPGDPKNNVLYRMLSTGDAIHVAAAITHEATQLLTRDRRPGRGNLPLLALADPQLSPNMQICGCYDLKITDPESYDLLAPLEG